MAATRAGLALRLGIRDPGALADRVERWLYLPTAALILVPSRFSSLGVLAIVLVRGLRWLTTGRAIDRTPLDWPLAGLLAMGLVGLLVSVDPARSLPVYFGLLLGVHTYYLFVHWVRADQAIERAAGVVLLAGATLAMVLLVSTDWFPSKLLPLGAVYNRLPRLDSIVPAALGPRSTEGFHPNAAGTAMAMLLPVALGLVLFSGSRRLRFLAAAVAVPIAVTLFLSQSRSSYVGAATALALLFVLRWRRLAVPLLLAFVAIAVAAYLAGLSDVPTLLRQLDEASARNETSSVSRLELWNRAWYMVQDFPYTGIGLNTFPLVLDALYPSFLAGPEARIPHAHNLYLNTAVDFGLPGLVAFLGLVALTARAAIGNRRTWTTGPWRGLGTGLACGLMVLLVFGLTDAAPLGTRSSFMLWIELGLLIGLTTSETRLSDDRCTGESPATGGRASGPASGRAR